MAACEQSDGGMLRTSACTHTHAHKATGVWLTSPSDKHAQARTLACAVRNRTDKLHPPGASVEHRKLACGTSVLAVSSEVSNTTRATHNVCKDLSHASPNSFGAGAQEREQASPQESFRGLTSKQVSSNIPEIPELQQSPPPEPANSPSPSLPTRKA